MKPPSFWWKRFLFISVGFGANDPENSAKTPLKLGSTIHFHKN